jgi:hypothetical protein
MSELTFDAARHEYRMNGFRIPSVTQVLDDVLGKSYGATVEDAAWYADKGKSLHACAALIAQGEDFDAPKGIEGHVEAVRSFFRCFGIGARRLIEYRVYSETFRYAGTLDLADIDAGILFDYKASQEDERNKSQLAGYAVALNEMTGWRRKWKGITVKTRDDGTYRCSKMYDLDKARPEWLACRTVYGIRDRTGAHKGERQ